jgi:hypothetical protein
MLYEPHNHLKKIIIIGVAALFLAVLAIVAVPLLYRQTTLQTPMTNLSPQAKLEREKIQKEQDKLIEMARKQKDPIPSADQLQKDSNRLVEEAKSSGAGKSSKEIQKDMNDLINAAKK